jgi:hypothetical protein
MRWVIATSAVALFLAGCGGSDESSAESWANDVCGRAVEWRDDVSGKVDAFQQNPDVSQLGSTIDDVAASTQDFVADLHKIGAPDTPSGDQAQAQVEQLADGLGERVDRVQASVGTGGLGALQTVGDEISGAVEDVKQTASSIEALSDGLRQGIEDASSCKELRGSS